MIKLRLYWHSRTTPHTSPLRANYGGSFVSYTKKNDRDISRVHCMYSTCCEQLQNTDHHLRLATCTCLSCMIQSVKIRTFPTKVEGRRIVLLYENGLNSLWPDDATWRQGYRSTLVQVMACCLTAPSHYLNQCSLITSKVQSHSSGNHFTKDTSAINHWNQFENYLYKFSSKSPRGQWVNTCALHPATAYRMTVVESVKCLFVGVSD